MKFRPCIDIHNGKVKQIVGKTLNDNGDFARENFVSDLGAKDYALLYKEKGLSGGHIIILNPASSEYYEDDLREALSALKAYSGGLQIGGGINEKNAYSFIEAGASHIIVTSFVFKDGIISYENLEKLIGAVGKEHIVLDLSCGKRNDKYYIVTDRWQKFTDTEVTNETIKMLSGYCDEFLVHAVDNEGKASGIESEIAEILSDSEIPSTYAGGIASYEDIEKLKLIGKGKVDFTVGSALDIFGGKLEFEKVSRYGKS